MKIRSSIHNHCTFCDGMHTAEEMILSAIDNGFEDFGLSSHCPIERLNVDWSLKDEDGYKKTVFDLKEKYKDRIRVYCGLEMDYYSNSRDGKGYDYLIDSVHEVISDGKSYSIDHSAEYFEVFLKALGDGYSASKLYYDTVKAMLSERDVKVLCHVDLVTKFNDGYKYFDEGDERYLREVYSTLDYAIEKDAIIEVNYGAIARKCKKTPYPAAYLLNFLREKNAKLLIGADCHNKDYLSFGFQEGEDLLLSYGFDHVYVFKAGKFEELGIK